ncbi:outer membrane beta-barrel protein [Helicobacter sp. 11S02596-1]|uniref:outer membrane beta-barrel protein n=1 Tax=Helicobacter sp. 11S02596-1 TaxID=1476194 RepID=UPI000BA756A7|nr:outer membrane beta-barrel protein [Helicobacter sp. 11S02596-1]PAF44440.1 hypothetical protein BJI48_02635 [Helicobacter sp. 11S02596-1]
MGRFLKVTLCSMVLCSALNAENNGAFIGVSAQVGAGSATAEANISTIASGVETNNSAIQKSNTLITGFGIKLGYKYFFTQGLGIRAYGFTDSGKFIFSPTNVVSLLNYGVGAEALYNVVALPSFDFGVFGGLGLGANTYFYNSYQVTTKKNGKTRKTNSSDKNTHFQMTLDLGVRAILKSGSSIELGFKAPLLTNTISEQKSVIYKSTTTQVIEMIGTTRHNFSFYASYVYAF